MLIGEVRAVEHNDIAGMIPFELRAQNVTRTEPVAKQRLLGSMLRQIGEYANASAAAGGFDRDDANISRLSLRMDERGWQQLAAASKKWLAEVEKIEAGVKKRLKKPGDEHDLMDVGLVMLLFEALPLSEAATPSQNSGARTPRKRVTSS